MTEPELPISDQPSLIPEAAAAQPQPDSGLSDAAERQAALNPARSCVVESPAGAGKTELLLQRYLGLLAEVDRPDRVLAITFTRKAASEIRQRVLRALEACLDPRQRGRLQPKTIELAGRVRQKNWGLERMPNQLRIQTIDAFCASLAQSLPFEARLGGVLRLLEGDPAQDYRLAARRLLLKVRDAGPIADQVRNLLLHFDNQIDRLETRLMALLVRRDQWQEAIGVQHSPEDLEHFRERLESAYRIHIEAQLAALVSELSRVDADLRISGLQIAAAICGYRLDLDRLETADALPVWKKFANLLLTKQGGWHQSWNIRDGIPPENRAQKKLLGKLIADLMTWPRMQLAFQQLQKLPSERIEADQWETLKSLLWVLPYAVAELKLIWSERGAVDFIEMAQAARRALGDEEAPTDLEIVLDDRIQHILIDEFQDTSRAQFDLLRRLTANWQAGDGRTLFIVGDPKQSIYGWRQAEMGLFLNIERLLPALNLQRLRLRVNFRSNRSLVQWVNHSFPTVFAHPAGPEPDVVSFSSSDPAPRSLPGVEILPALVFYDRLANPRSPLAPREARQREAQAVVRHVQRLRELLAQDATAMPASPARIAVLVRERSHASAIVAEMRRQKILFQAVALARLGESQVVQDLRALVRALAYPADRTAWLAVLRAPWCGLTLADLHELAAGDPDAPVWELLNAHALQGQARARIERVLPILRQALQLRQAQGLRRAVEAAWLRLGGPACLPQDEQSQWQLPEQLRAFWSLLEEYESGGELRNRAAWEAQLQNLMAPPAAFENQRVNVQVMTLHAAKGLEFEAVILPGLDRPPGKNSEPELPLLWVDVEAGTNRPLLGLEPARGGADPQYEYLKLWRKYRRREEDKRLLYVAATRAIRHLVLSACLGMKGQAVCDPAEGSLLKPLWPAVRRDWLALAPSEPPAAVAGLDRPEHPPLQRLRLDWTPPSSPPSLSGGTPFAVSEPEPVSFDWVSESLRQVGIVVHAMLQRIQREGLELWSAGRVEETRPQLRTALAAGGVPAGELAHATQTALEALRNALTDDRGRWLLKTHEAERSEWELSGVLDGRLYNVRIDRCFIDSGARWIVDYKTSRHSGGNLDKFLDNELVRHREQLRRYARLVRAWQDAPTALPIRLGLYFPLLCAWRELGADD